MFASVFLFAFQCMVCVTWHWHSIYIKAIIICRGTHLITLQTARVCIWRIHENNNHILFRIHSMAKEKKCKSIRDMLEKRWIFIPLIREKKQMKWIFIANHNWSMFILLENPRWKYLNQSRSDAWFMMQKWNTYVM